MSAVGIEVRGLTKVFDTVTAVRDLTFEGLPGQVTGFLGSNGAGKTTTLRMVLGLVRPTAGVALVGGVPYAELRHARRVVGAVLDASAVHPGRTGRGQLRLLAASAGVPDARVAEMLELVQLTPAADRRTGGYSMGMRQRLALAGAMLGDPAVLILDEPANGLDPAGIAWLRGLLRGLAAEGRTVVVSSHLLGEVAQTVDRVVILDRGALRFAGPLDDLGGSDRLEAEFLRLTAGGAAGGIG